MQLHVQPDLISLLFNGTQKIITFLELMIGVISSCKNFTVKAPHRTLILLIYYLLTKNGFLLIIIVNLTVTMQFTFPHEGRLAFCVTNIGDA